MLSLISAFFLSDLVISVLLCVSVLALLATVIMVGIFMKRKSKNKETDE